MLITIFIIWFMIPISMIIFFENHFIIFTILIVHIYFNVYCVLNIGGIIFSSCFIYLSTLRIVIFSIATESIILLSIMSLYAHDVLSNFSLKEINITQFYISNVFFMNIVFIIFFCIIILLDGLRLPFDYSECESELVAGIMTEFSGAYFALYSIAETNHILLDCLFLVAILLGNYMSALKFILTLIFLVFFPRALICRFKITNTMYLVICIFFSFLIINLYIIFLSHTFVLV